MKPCCEQQARDAIEDLGLVTQDPTPRTRRPIPASCEAEEHAQSTVWIEGAPGEPLSAAHALGCSSSRCHVRTVR